MTFRVGGLATGFDTDAMVKEMMKAYQIPLDKIKQDRQIVEWKRDDYRAINTQVLAFRNAAFDMRLQGTYTAKKATSENEQFFTATATSQAVEGTYTLEVERLAKSASLTSLERDEPIKNRLAKMSELGLSANTTLTVGGSKGNVTVEIKPTDTIADVVNNINNRARITGVNFSYDENLDRFFLTNPATGESSNITLKSSDPNLFTNVFKLPGTSQSKSDAQTITASKSFESSMHQIIPSEPKKGDPEPEDKIKYPVKDQYLRLEYDINNDNVKEVYDFTVKGDTSIGNLIDQINASELSKNGVTAYLDGSGKLAFFNQNDSKELVFSEVSADSQDDVNLLHLLGIQDKAGANTFTKVSDVEYSELSVNGQDAKIKFNGIEATYKTNSFAVNGINVSVKKTTTEALDLTVTGNTDAVFDKVKSFVEKYNSLIDEVNKKLGETRSRDYLPLTEEQKQALSEDQVKKWEEKAKSGMLRNDTVLRGALYTFRSALNNVVSGLNGSELKQLLQVGITTAPYSMDGKLQINEEQLRKAIAERPEEVVALFTADDGNAKSSSGDGIAVRLHEQATQLIDKLKSIAGTSDMVDAEYEQGKKLKEFDDRIYQLTRRMSDIEKNYYSRFAAMEKFINQMNAQSNWLAQQLGSMQQKG